MEPFRADVVHTDGTATVVLRGELDIGGVDVLETVIGSLVGRFRASQVTLDCARLTFLDATGLSALLALQRAFGDGRFTLRRPHERVLFVLRTTRTDVLFHLEIATR